MNRRSFLRLLGIGAGAAAVGESLLPEAAEKVYSFPAPPNAIFPSFAHQNYSMGFIVSKEIMEDWKGVELTNLRSPYLTDPDSWHIIVENF